MIQPTGLFVECAEEHAELMDDLLACVLDLLEDHDLASIRAAMRAMADGMEVEAVH